MSFDSLSRLIGDAEKHLRLLDEAGGPAAAPELVRASFLLMLLSLQREARELAEDETAPDELKARCIRFVASVEAIKAGSKRVDDHLIELTEGWRCEKCASSVASGAVLSKEIPSGLGFRCQRCGETTAATRAGLRMFEEIFGSPRSMNEEEARSRGLSLD